MSKIPGHVLAQAAAPAQQLRQAGAQTATTQAKPQQLGTLDPNDQQAKATQQRTTAPHEGHALKAAGVKHQGELPKSQLGGLRSVKPHELPTQSSAKPDKSAAAASYSRAAQVRPAASPQPTQQRAAPQPSQQPAAAKTAATPQPSANPSQQAQHAKPAQPQPDAAAKQFARPTAQQPTPQREAAPPQPQPGG